ncbi:hypothetical protein [Nocardia neocaledoniensis]|uniref:hypothetical protein n=1 Tax=Nocardia neocaledoniensis TaxID=236511 RepID=UPI002455BA59|nr:hypothetical protein [Nocardia neocaledoniensis]
MADDTPLASLIEQARNGNLNVGFSDNIAVNADEFVYIERDCEAFKDKIRLLQRTAEGISKRENWGLGEDKDRLASAQTLVGRFRGKAKIVDPARDSDNNVYDILEQHYKIVDDIQILHRTIAQKYRETDAAFAAEYDRMTANLPASPISTNPPGKIEPGTTSIAVGQS